MLDSSCSIKTSSFFPRKNARGRNDQDYNCNRYTYLKVLDIILTIDLKLIEMTVSVSGIIMSHVKLSVERNC